MVERAKKPSALSATPGVVPQAQVNITDGNSKVTATLPTGESVEVFLYGATVTSWKDAQGDEKLWVSEGAVLDGTKAIRGGVPVVFPVFGTSPDHASTASLPQHGFARTSRWEFLGKSTTESGTTKSGGDNSVKLDFGLSHNNLSEENKKAWPYDFGLIYSVTLSSNSLTTSIVVQNTGEKTWDFQTLQHTYFKIKDVKNISITGLEASPYHDKVTKKADNTSSNEPLTISSFTDRVYTPAGGPSQPIVISAGGKKVFELLRDNMNEVVVWNPWEDASKNMGDFRPQEGFKTMICVEAGAVKGWLSLDPGETWQGGVTAVLS